MRWRYKCEDTNNAKDATDANDENGANDATDAMDAKGAKYKGNDVLQSTSSLQSKQRISLAR